MPADPARETTVDAVLGGRLSLRQPKRGHRVGHDAILLAAAVAIEPGAHAVDFGAGVGSAGLALARRVPDVRVTLVEIDPWLAALAAENIVTNALSDRVRAIAADVEDVPALTSAGLAPASADAVLMNPPFNDPGRQTLSPDALRRLAHAASPDLLPRWLDSAATVLKPSGRITLIWRADNAAMALAVVAAHFGGLVVRPLQPKPGAAAIRVLIEGTKGAPTGQTAGPPLVLADDDGRPSAAAEAILRDGQGLAFKP